MYVDRYYRGLKKKSLVEYSIKKESRKETDSNVTCILISL